MSAVWIKTEPSVDGARYVVTIEASEDLATTLSPDRALRYASGVLEAASRADYDAAVFKQVTALTSLQAARQLVVDLRGDRPPLDDEATYPIALEPGVNRSQEPFLTIRINGEPVGQWGIQDARSHALGVLEAVGRADLDSAYYRTLVGTVGLDENRARQVVADVGNHTER